MGEEREDSVRMGSVPLVALSASTLAPYGHLFIEWPHGALKTSMGSSYFPTSGPSVAP